MSVYLSVCPSPTSLLNLHSAEGADVGHDATISCLGRRFVVSTHRSIHLFIYTVGHKKRDTFIFFDNLDKYWPIFVIFFTAIYNNNELRNKNLLKFLPHLKSVAALPCETWNVKCTTVRLLRERPTFSNRNGICCGVETRVYGVVFCATWSES